jgi:phosphopantetheinyl transferase (holo-ACP synthase)
MKRDDSQLTQAWETYYREFNFNIIPVGHEKIVALAFEALADAALKVRLADHLGVAPAQVLDTLRNYLKHPTFSSEIKKLLSEFIPHIAQRGATAIPALDRITGIRKAQDRNSYVHFYDERIDDATFEKMLNAYGRMATGIAVLLREDDRVCVLDFDDRKTLIDLLRQLGYPCDESNLDETLLRVFPQNPIVATYRGFHVYFYDADLAEAVKTYRNLGKIEVRVSRCYVLLPPSLSGFEPAGATLLPTYYRQVRPLLPEAIREPLPTKIKNYLLAQIRPQMVSATLSLAPTPQQPQPTASDLKTFIVDTLLPYWRKGVRDQLTYPLAGVLRRAGIHLSDALDIVATICDRAGDEEKSDRLYQVRRQYNLPFRQKGKLPYCAGVNKLRDACLTAGIPPHVVNNLVARIFGLKVTTNLLDWLEDYRQIAEKIAAIVRNDIVFNEMTMSWWVYHEDQKRWVETKREEILHFIVKAALEVRNDIEELVRLSHDNTISKQVSQKLNKLLNSQFIRNNVLPILEILLSVNFAFPRIPDEAQTLTAPVTRITAHQNGVLLWLKNGETIFYPCKPNEPEPHRLFFVTKTFNSVVDEEADPQPYINFVSELVDDRETAEYLLQILASTLGLGRNPFKRFLLLLGGGRNGKNSLIQTIKAAFDDLVQYTTTKILISNQQDNATLSAKYALKGCAFAVIDEAPSTAAWDIETIKQLAGGDEIVVKKLYRDTETISITWINLILSNNYPSSFRQQSYAIADRIIAINFPLRFSDRVETEGRYLRRKDEERVEAIKQDTAAIIQAFRWAFKEAARKNFKLTEPPKVAEFTEPIRLLADNVGHFLETQTIEDANASVPAQTLYDAYKEFVKEHDLGAAISKRAFINTLLVSNFKKRKENGLVYIVGLKLKDGNQPALTTIWSDNGDGNHDSDDGQDYLDEFPF